MNNMCDSLLSDAFTIYLTLSGILVSLITLLYSFLNGKRSELELCAEALKSGHNDPLMRRRQSLLIHQILKLSKINDKIFIIFLMSVAACFISWASLRFLPDSFHLGALWMVGVFTLIIGAMTLNLARKLYLHYKKDSTIQ